MGLRTSIHTNLLASRCHCESVKHFGLPQLTGGTSSRSQNVLKSSSKAPAAAEGQTESLQCSKHIQLFTNSFIHQRSGGLRSGECC